VRDRVESTNFLRLRSVTRPAVEQKDRYECLIIRAFVTGGRVRIG